MLSLLFWAVKFMALLFVIYNILIIATGRYTDLSRPIDKVW